MKRKSLVVPTIYLLLVFSISIGLYLTKKTYNTYEEIQEEQITYVSGSILSRSIPIVDIKSTLTYPYLVEVKIEKDYYNSNDDIETKQNSLILYNNTYMPNSGIDYGYKQTFDVLSVYDGTVIDVKEDELLGNTVSIRHNNEVISVYQSLGRVDVKKGDIVVQGQVIGTSGYNKLNNSGNHLHFEIYKNGETKDPIDCFGKNIGDI